MTLIKNQNNEVKSVKSQNHEMIVFILSLEIKCFNFYVRFIISMRFA